MAPNTKPAHPALMLMAPLLLLVVAEGVLELWVEAKDVVKEGVVEPPVAVGVAEARGAVDCPAISDRTADEKEPVIFVRVNWPEKDSQGTEPFLPLSDSKRTK